MYEEKQYLHRLVLTMVLDIHWGPWNISPLDKGEEGAPYIIHRRGTPNKEQ